MMINCNILSPFFHHIRCFTPSRSHDMASSLGVEVDLHKKNTNPPKIDPIAFCYVFKTIIHSYIIVQRLSLNSYYLHHKYKSLDVIHPTTIYMSTIHICSIGMCLIQN